jgi:hypothetical protein
MPGPPFKEDEFVKGQLRLFGSLNFCSFNEFPGSVVDFQVGARVHVQSLSDFARASFVFDLLSARRTTPHTHPPPPALATGASTDPRSRGFQPLAATTPAH